MSKPYEYQAVRAKAARELVGFIGGFALLQASISVGSMVALLLGKAAGFDTPPWILRFDLIEWLRWSIMIYLLAVCASTLLRIEHAGGGPRIARVPTRADK